MDVGEGIGEARPEVREQHRRLLLRPRVAVGHVGGDLLVARVDELDLGVLEGGEDGDVRVATEPEQVFDAAVFEVLDELMRDELLHGFAFGSNVRGAGPV